MRIIAIVFVLLATFLFPSCKGVRPDNSTADQAVSLLAQGEGQPEIEDIKQLVRLETTKIIDVRTPEEFDEGHIANSTNIPLNTISDSLDVLKQYRNIIVVCRSGKRSAKAKEILNENGFANVYDGKGWSVLNELLK